MYKHAGSAHVFETLASRIEWVALGVGGEQVHIASTWESVVGLFKPEAERIVATKRRNAEIQPELPEDDGDGDGDGDENRTKGGASASTIGHDNDTTIMLGPGVSAFSPIPHNPVATATSPQSMLMPQPSEESPMQNPTALPPLSASSTAKRSSSRSAPQQFESPLLVTPARSNRIIPQDQHLQPVHGGSQLPAGMSFLDESTSQSSTSSPGIASASTPPAPNKRQKRSSDFSQREPIASL